MKGYTGVYSAHTSRAQTLRHVCMHFECRGVNTKRNDESRERSQQRVGAKGGSGRGTGGGGRQAGRAAQPGTGSADCGRRNRSEKCPKFPENRDAANPRVAPLASAASATCATAAPPPTGVPHRLGATTIHRKDGSSEACAATGRLAARPARAGAAVSLFHLRPTQLVFWGS